MIRIYNIFKNTFLISVLFLAIGAGPVLAYDFKSDGGLDTTAQKTGHLEIPLLSGDNPLGIIGVVIGVILSLLGVVFLILIIYGGILWMTAAGNEDKVGEAKKIIVAGIIGLVIILASWGIANFVLTSLLDSV